MTPLRLTWRGRFVALVVGGLLAAAVDPMAHGFFTVVVWAGDVVGVVP